MKFLWFDTETTGVDPVKNDIIQIAGQIVIDGVVLEEFDIRCQPHNWDNVEDKALEVNGITRKQLATFDKPQTAYNELISLLDRYVNKYNKEDKMFASGQNIQFDKEFTNQFFKKCGNNYFFSYIHGASLCTLTLAVMLEATLKIKIFKPNYKLETLCKCMDIKLDNAHDALADIKATREVANEMMRRIQCKK